MIAKSVTRKTKGKGFSGLAKYVGNEKKMAAVPGGWGATAAYIVGEGHNGAKVAPGSIRFTNCASETMGEAVKEIELTQAQCKRGNADRTYHLVISFPDGETPVREQLEDIEDELVKAIGFDEHQRLSAVHTDTDHLHIHVAINKVNPESFRNIAPSFDKRKLMAACERMEIKHGLTREHGERIEMTDGSKIGGRAGDMEAHSGEQSLLRWVRDNAKAVLIAELNKSSTWADLHAAAAQHGLEFRRRGAGLILAVVDHPKLAVKASDVDRGLAFKALTDKFGAFAPRDIATEDGQLHRIEKSQSPPSPQDNATSIDKPEELPPNNIQNATDLLSWVRENAKADLIAARDTGSSWEDLQAAAAKHGLEFRLRGAGLTLALIGRPKLAIKASDVDRGLAFKALTAKFGAFAPRAAAIEDAQLRTLERGEGRSPPLTEDVAASLKPEPMQTVNTQNGQRRYDSEESSHYDRPPGQPRQMDREGAALRAQFKIVREQSKIQRAAALEDIREKHSRYRAGLRAWSTQQPQRAYNFGSTPAGRQQTRETRQKRMIESIQQAASEREKARKTHRVPNWVEFLQGEAEHGSEPALKLLRTVERRRREIALNLLYAADVSASKTIVLQGLDKSVGKDGTVYYRTQDGGSVQDRSHGIGVNDVTASSALLAVMLAQERFDQPLSIKGTDAFKRAVARAAAIPGVSVAFADPQMEILRKEAIREREEAARRGPPAPTYLVVPFKHRDAVRNAGAEWDSDRKEWSVPAGIDPRDLGLSVWVPGNGRVSAERTYLNVRLSERSEAKRAGAEWDNNRKMWFVPSGRDLQDVARWMPLKEEAAKPIIQKTHRTPLEDYVAGRNEARQLISSIPRHRMWGVSDEGEGVYCGYVTLYDNTKAALIEKDGTVLVLPVKEEQAAEIETLKTGQVVTMGKEGSLTTGRSKGRSR